MWSAPAGQVKTLPQDWENRVQAYQADGPAAPFVERIKEIVAKLGAKSIALRRVQELALVTCGLGAAPPFQGHAEILGRLIAACGGTWPIEEPLKEYKTKKRIEDVDNDLRSIEAEWRVLDRLIGELWIPLPSTRGEALPDWRVRRLCRTLAVDAKQKLAMRGTHMLLTWALRGLAHLPDWSFLRTYSWDWSVAPTCRAQLVSHFVNQLFGGKIDLQARLASRLVDGPEQIAGAPDLLLERYDEQTFLLTCRLKDEGLSVTASPNRHGPLFNPGGGQAAMVDDVLADETLDELAPVLGRTGLDKRQPSLIVLVWPVPFDWEPIYGRSQIEPWWQRASEARRWPPAILWPVGNFEVRATPWMPNTAAKKLLGCNLAPLTSIINPHQVVRLARSLLVRQ